MASSDISTWSYSAEDEAEAFLLALLAKFKQQQQIPIEQAPNLDDGESDEDECEGSDTVRNVDIRKCDHDGLKRCFLDRFAELLACKKDPCYVSSAALVERGARADDSDEATIYVARNSGFGKDDLDFFVELTETMRHLARGMFTL